MSVVAVIDCGTNSTRLFITGPNGPIARELRITRLGEGVHETRTLAPIAIQRTVAALAEFREIIEKNAVQKVRAVATSAARDAVNRDEFFSAALDALGAPIELLRGEEEGRLTFAGATAGLDAPPYLVLDIGGGSTELVLGDSNGVLEVRSIDTGCVRLTEQCLGSDPCAPEELANAFAIVDEWLTDVSATMAIAETRPALIGVAGTVTSIAALDLDLEAYDADRIHRHVLERDAVESIFRSLSMQTSKERESESILPPGRADIIVAGLVILLGVMRHFDFESCHVSETDILDGLAGSLLHAPTS